jgi:hypothetical protein
MHRPSLFRHPTAVVVVLPRLSLTFPRGLFFSVRLFLAGRTDIRRRKASDASGPCRWAVRAACGGKVAMAGEVLLPVKAIPSQIEGAFRADVRCV